ncbi:hypothetical protein HJFPF1_11219 [Paramyrothecium foliicola]|nr:hypothetical protein HJFPF1_11219 [Paramyrothecium foliicola]
MAPEDDACCVTLKQGCVGDKSQKGGSLLGTGGPIPVELAASNHLGEKLVMVISIRMRTEQTFFGELRQPPRRPELGVRDQALGVSELPLTADQT